MTTAGVLTTGAKDASLDKGTRIRVSSIKAESNWIINTEWRLPGCPFSTTGSETLKGNGGDSSNCLNCALTWSGRSALTACAACLNIPPVGATGALKMARPVDAAAGLPPNKVGAQAENLRPKIVVQPENKPPVAGAEAQLRNNSRRRTRCTKEICSTLLSRRSKSSESSGCSNRCRTQAAESSTQEPDTFGRLVASFTSSR